MNEVTNNKLNRVILEKAINTRLVKKLTVFTEAGRDVAVLSIACH
jgi:hypothetical protein